jgi:hypothetical protein
VYLNIWRKIVNGLRHGLWPLTCSDRGFEYCWEHECLSLVGTVCCQVEVSVSGLSLVQRSLTKYGVSKCDHEASIMRRPWPTRSCCAMGKKWNKITKIPQLGLLVSRAGLKPNPPKHHNTVFSPSVSPANVNVLDIHVHSY